MNMEEDSNESPTPVFDCPLPASEVENTFRMAQVLGRTQRYGEAISRYIQVCESLERALRLDCTSPIDIRFAIFSLRAIADIYAAREDWPKSLAFRDCEQSFLHHINEHPATRLEDDPGALPDFAAITIQTELYLALFEKIHRAIEIPEKVTPTPAETAKRCEAAIAEENRAKEERVMRILADPVEQRGIGSIWSRNFDRLVDHPWVVIGLVSFFLVLGFVVFERSQSHRTAKAGSGNRESFLERMAQAKRERDTKAKQRKTKKRPTTARTLDSARPDLFEI
jgi:hypothetical protein